MRRPPTLDEARVVGIVTDPVDLDLSALYSVKQVLPILPTEEYDG